MFNKIDWTPKFKQEWSWLEMEGIMAYLQRLFKENYNIKDIEDKFGLPYTSSSSFAVIGNTNCEFEIEKGINLDGFALIENEFPYVIALGTDNDEKCYYYIVEGD